MEEYHHDFPFRRQTAIGWFWVVAFLCVPPVTTHSRSSQEEENNRFIVAFELTPQGGYRFTWPYPAMPPAPYDEVLMVVERMPRVIHKPGKKPAPLRPLAHLQVNGRSPAPTRKKKAFLVQLDEGRIRFAIAVPEGVELATPPGTAKIKLYQVAKD